MDRTVIPLGVGIYTQPEAALLLGVYPRRLRRWVNGYTYRQRQTGARTARKRPPLIRSDLPVISGAVALSFVELMELRVVKALLDKDVSLQAIRAAADVASRFFETAHPLASRRIFTDGRRIYATVERDADRGDYVELTRGRVLQLIAGGVLEPFLEEIDFSERTALARRWWPLGRETPVVLDPQIAFGAPVLEGTAIRTSVLAGMAEEVPAAEVAEAYAIDVSIVRAAVAFETHLRAA